MRRIDRRTRFAMKIHSEPCKKTRMCNVWRRASLFNTLNWVNILHNQSSKSLIKSCSRENQTFHGLLMWTSDGSKNCSLLPPISRRAAPRQILSHSLQWNNSSSSCFWQPPDLLPNIFIHSRNLLKQRHCAVTSTMSGPWTELHSD